MYLHEINKWRMSLDVKLWFTRWQSLAYITFDSGLYEDELYDCKDNDVPSDDYVDAGWTDNEDLYNNGELYNDGGQIVTTKVSLTMGISTKCTTMTIPTIVWMTTTIPSTNKITNSWTTNTTTETTTAATMNAMMMDTTIIAAMAMETTTISTTT